jgi:hypothetical protein
MDGMSIGEVGRRTGFEPDHCILPMEIRRRSKRHVVA